MSTPSLLNTSLHRPILHPPLANSKSTRYRANYSEAGNSSVAIFFVHRRAHLGSLARRALVHFRERVWLLHLSIFQEPRVDRCAPSFFRARIVDRGGASFPRLRQGRAPDSFEAFAWGGIARHLNERAGIGNLKRWF